MKNLALYFVALCLLSVGSAQAQYSQQTKASGGSGLYYWYDAAGQLHVTDQLHAVPEAYRGAAVNRERAGDTGPEGNVTQVHGSAVFDGAGKAPDDSGKESDTDKEAYWRGRLKAEKDKKAAAESRLTEIESEMIYVRSQTPLGFHQRLAELEEEQKQVMLDIEEASEALDGGLAEEARRAGALPGWLR